jgi:hypothetical protein
MMQLGRNKISNSILIDFAVCMPFTKHERADNSRITAFQMIYKSLLFFIYIQESIVNNAKDLI